MKSEGFTLIELLGVIIVLCVLVTMISVTVTNVLNDSEAKLTEIQIEKLKDAAKNYYINEGMSSIDFKQDSFDHCVSINYLIKNGYIDENEVSNIETNEYMLGSIKIHYENKKYKYTYSEGNCQICKEVTEDTKTKGNIPNGDYLPGDEYICEVKPETKYHFFILSTDDEKINLILDRNINSDGTLVTEAITEANAVDGIYNLTAWINKSDYDSSNTDNTSCSSTVCGDEGPITAIKFLEKATDSWIYIESMNQIYNDESNRYKEISFIGRARLPKYSELYGEDKCLTAAENSGASCVLWLRNYINNANLSKDGGTRINGIGGYWTLSTKQQRYAWFVEVPGRLDADYSMNASSSFGIRPVITITKTNFENKDRR